MKKAISAFLLVLLLGCGQGVEFGNMTTVDMPENWTEEEGQAFLEKIDQRKLQFAVIRQFPALKEREVNYRILPTVFTPYGDKEKYFKYRVVATSTDGWEKTTALEEFIAAYLTTLISNKNDINPMVFVDLPAGVNEQEANKLLHSLNWAVIQSKIAEMYPSLSPETTHFKMLPVALSPLDPHDRQVKIHVMVLTEATLDVEYDIELIIAEQLKLQLPKT